MTLIRIKTPTIRFQTVKTPLFKNDIFVAKITKHCLNNEYFYLTKIQKLSTKVQFSLSKVNF